MRGRWYPPGSLHQNVFEFLRQYCQHRDALVEFGNRWQTKNSHRQLNTVALGSGLVSKQQFLEFFIEFSGGGGVAISNVLERIYDSLIYWDVLTQFSVFENFKVDFQINFMAVERYERLKVLENIVKGPNFVILRYLMATAAIVVQTNIGESIGSGCIVSSNGRTFLLTNKHVVNPADGIKLDRMLLGGRHDHPIDVSKLILSEADDLALLPVAVPETYPRFFLGDVPHALQEVILLGFPKIPLTASPELTAHSGEINATIETRNKEQLYLISNYASPGSSGGPLVDYRGLLIGVVSDRLEAQYEGERPMFQHSAAVTLERIERFISRQAITQTSG